jgi:hypothetical protein
MRTLRLTLVSSFCVVALLQSVDDGYAQSTARLQVTRRAVVTDAPRVDGFVLATVDAGLELDVISQRGLWLQVALPSTFSSSSGWIQISAVRMLTALPGPPPVPKGRQMIRGFATAGPTLFTAKQSFETILGSSSGLMYGGGAQLVLANGVFVLGGYERYKKTGSRVLVSGTQYFTLPVKEQVVVTPIHLTVGFRDYKRKSIVPYLGFGIGWQQLRETASDSGESERKGHVSGHVLVGVERPLAPWFTVAGELQWTSAPKTIGQTGVSAALGEDNLGGITLRIKMIVGR